MRKLALRVGVSIVVAGSVLGALAVDAEAQEPHRELRCPSMPDASPALATIPTPLRLHFIQTTLDDQRSRARLWTYAWMAEGLAVGGAQVGWAAAGPASAQVDHITGAVGSVIPVATMAIFPLKIMDAAPNTNGDALSCEDLARAEQIFAVDAADESSKAGPLAHVMGIGGPLAAAAFLGFGYGHWDSAAIAAGAGIVTSELRLLTQPTGAVDAYRNYREGVLTGPARTMASLSFSPIASPTFAGGAISGTF